MVYDNAMSLRALRRVAMARTSTGFLLGIARSRDSLGMQWVALPLYH